MQAQDSFVCAECVDEPDIRNFMEGKRVEAHCSFCDVQSMEAVVAPLEAVAARICACLRYEYGDAAQELFYDGREGGYQGRCWSTRELLDEVELDLPGDESGRLIDEIVSLLPDLTWCEPDPYLLDEQDRVRISWSRFSAIVKHRRRFFFADYDKKTDIYSPREMLKELFRASEIYDLFRCLPPGTQLFRARWQRPGTTLTTAQELGPPPKELAIQSNRMSPPGIPMFYACEDPETALMETANSDGQFAVACFRTCRPVTILDLTDIPPVPGLFQPTPDGLDFRPRDVLGFLNHIADEMSKPIQRDKRVHISYIPTQVVTEYVRSQLNSGGTRIDGVKYSSAVHPGHASYVMFATQENILQSSEASLPPDADQWLELASTRQTYVTQKPTWCWKEDWQTATGMIGTPPTA